MKRKTLVPNDFRDFLSILSFMGFLGIFLSFSFDISWINDNMTGIFLIIGGSAFLVIGKVVSAHRWLRDGINQNEPTQLLSIIIGLSSITIGILLLVNISLPERFLGYIGIIALVPALYTIIDYYLKNNKRR